jgi:hypothetical protein
MSDRLVVVLSSGDPKVLEMGLMYAQNTVKQGWMADTKLFLFGPSEVSVVTDPRLRELLKATLEEGIVPIACKYCADKHTVSELLETLGCVVQYVGEPLSAAIREGYTPMVW